jgi:hypothetical protein
LRRQRTCESCREILFPAILLLGWKHPQQAVEERPLLLRGLAPHDKLETLGAKGGD